MNLDGCTPLSACLGSVTGCFHKIPGLGHLHHCAGLGVLETWQADLMVAPKFPTDFTMSRYRAMNVTVERHWKGSVPRIN